MEPTLYARRTATKYAGNRFCKKALLLSSRHVDPASASVVLRKTSHAVEGSHCYSSTIKGMQRSRRVRTRNQSKGDSRWQESRSVLWRWFIHRSSAGAVYNQLFCDVTVVYRLWRLSDGISRNANSFLLIVVTRRTSGAIISLAIQLLHGRGGQDSGAWGDMKSLKHRDNVFGCVKFGAFPSTAICCCSCSGCLLCIVTSRLLFVFSFFFMSPFCQPNLFSILY